MSEFRKLIRVFKVGALELRDPAPHLEPAEALKLHEAAHPFLSACSLGGSEVSGDRLIYSVERPAAATKG